MPSSTPPPPPSTPPPSSSTPPPSPSTPLSFSSLLLPPPPLFPSPPSSFLFLPLLVNTTTAASVASFAELRENGRERSALKHSLILDLIVALKDSGHTLRPALIQVRRRIYGFSRHAHAHPCARTQPAHFVTQRIQTNARSHPRTHSLACSPAPRACTRTHRSPQ